MERLVSRKYSRSPARGGGTYISGNSRSPQANRFNKTGGTYRSSMEKRSGFKHSPLDTGLLSKSPNTTANAIKEDYQNIYSSVDAIRKQVKDIIDQS